MKKKASLLSLGTTLISLAAVLFSVNANAQFFKRLGEAKPRYTQAIWFAPNFDFDRDGCLPDAGISPGGRQNGGLQPSGAIGGACRHSGFMGLSNTYHRYVCKNVGRNKYCAHVYALYFQKDQIMPGANLGHRHDWEEAVVWTRNGRPTHASVSAHGHLSTLPWSRVPKWGNHPHAVYHKGAGTHSMRWAKRGENQAENPTRRWVLPTVASWWTMRGSVSNAVLTRNFSRFNYGSANLPVKHARMLRDVNRYKPAGFPSYTSNDMWASK